MTEPLVSVICLSHNHEKYIERAILSVYNQDYSNIELIVVDDASTDQTPSIIRSLSEKLGFQYLLQSKNIGNCKAFNKGFKKSKGSFIIDLAADDELYPTRVSQGVKDLGTRDVSYGVHFCDVDLVDPLGHSHGTHYRRNKEGQLMENVVDGNMYAILLEKYYISTPTMMIRRAVLEDLDGYDETLTYEDFDFWIRSSRKFKYVFSDKILVKKTMILNSHSSAQYQKKNPYHTSTAKVCAKAYQLNQNREEERALFKRIKYEMKWALITESWEACKSYLYLLKKLKGNSPYYLMAKLIAWMRPPWYYIWKKLF